MSHKTTEKAHNEGAEFTRESTRPSDIASNALDQFVEFADKAVDEVSRVGKQALTSVTMPPSSPGAVLGAVAGVLLPFISLPLGAIAGAGYVAYRQAQKSE